MYIILKELERCRHAAIIPTRKDKTDKISGDVSQGSRCGDNAGEGTIAIDEIQHVFLSMLIPEVRRPKISTQSHLRKDERPA